MWADAEAMTIAYLTGRLPYLQRRGKTFSESGRLRGVMLTHGHHDQVTITSGGTSSACAATACHVVCLGAVHPCHVKAVTTCLAA